MEKSIILNSANQFQKNKQDVLKAINHLEYSFKKVQKYDLKKSNWTEEERGF